LKKPFTPEQKTEGKGFDLVCDIPEEEFRARQRLNRAKLEFVENWPK
jgi:hypothetical protein